MRARADGAVLMWARDLELALGVWLVLSPFVFGHPSARADLWLNDLACGTAVVLLALMSYWRRLRRVHLAELVVAAWLVSLGWSSAVSSPTPASQNHMLVGLLIALFAVVPCAASRPPTGWRSQDRG